MIKKDLALLRPCWDASAGAAMYVYAVRVSFRTIPVASPAWTATAPAFVFVSALKAS